MELGRVVPDLGFVTSPGRVVALSRLCPGAAVLIFLRYPVSRPCEAYLEQIRSAHGEIERAGASVLVVSFELAEHSPNDLHPREWPFPVVADPTLEAYRAFGIVGAALAAPFEEADALAHGPWGNLRLLGGDFVIDAGHRLVYAHRQAEPADRRPVDALVSAVRFCRAVGVAATVTAGGSGG
jgi:peroxiredoxin